MVWHALGMSKHQGRELARRTTAAATRPPTHTGYTFHCLPIFLFTLLAYRPARRVSLSLQLLMSHVHPKAAARFCPRPTVLKAQQTMERTNGRLMFGEINNVAIKVTIVV